MVDLQHLKKHASFLASDISYRNLCCLQFLMVFKLPSNYVTYVLNSFYYFLHSLMLNRFHLELRITPFFFHRFHIKMHSNECRLKLNIEHLRDWQMQIKHVFCCIALELNIRYKYNFLQQFFSCLRLCRARAKARKTPENWYIMDI